MSYSKFERRQKELNEQIEKINFKQDHPMIFFIRNNGLSILIGIIIGIAIVFLMKGGA